MENLVASVSPIIDRLKAAEGHEVVLYADHCEIRVLSHYDGMYFVVGYCSVNSAEGEQIPGADFYCDGHGYVGDPLMSYACLPHETPESMWDEVYRELADVSMKS